MPEGNVIHNQARRINRAFRGHVVAVDSPQGRFAAAAAQVNMSMLVRAWARGKHLFIDVSRNRPEGGHAASAELDQHDSLKTIHVHLGLFGKWRFGSGEPPPVVGEVRLRLMHASRYAELRGPSVCELLDEDGVAAVLARIGPDPLHARADPDQAWRRLQRSTSAIGAVLMDQRTFAGVGNIYRAEVLFRHAMSPFRPARSVSRAEFDALWHDLVALMAQGTKRGRIDTVRDEHLPAATGRRPREDRHGGEVYVYRRTAEPCLVCGDEIVMTTMLARKLYWCPRCQAR